MIYNTLGRTKQSFEPVDPPAVKMYVCGPTVYDLLHVGNFRGAVFFNLVRNWLEHHGFEVTYVYNFTDIDDKIIQRAKDQERNPLKLSEQFIGEFRKDFERLGLRPHDHNPRCTHSIQAMVDLIESLVRQGNAYVVGGEVFYAIQSYKGYGKLSGKNTEQLQAGHRVDPDPRKKDPLDFVLWKPSKEGEPSWPSPWGPGRPGWHIECSAMNREIFGDRIDIHGGGVDLIFPHHENEIAQSEAVSGKPFARFWMHNNFIHFGDQKMSKSIGNVVKARDFMDAYHPEILKYMILSVHYRSILNLADDQIHQAIAALSRIYGALAHARILAEAKLDSDEKAAASFLKTLESHSIEADAALDDDFGTPAFFGQVFEGVRAFNATHKPGQKVRPVDKARAETFLEWIRKYGSMMSLFGEEPAVFLKCLDEILIREKGLDPGKIENLIEQRTRARAEKDFARADALRDELQEMDVLLHDGPDGTAWEIKKG